MRVCKASLLGLTAVLLLDGCASTPMGPTVAVMPAPNKPFQVFQEDQIICKNFASQQVSGQAEAANQTGVAGALLGTALGAGLGAAIGGGGGAGIGAAGGALAGTAVGAGGSERHDFSIQQQYDIAYSQCQYAKGNQVPGFSPSSATAVPPPPSGSAQRLR